MADTDRARSGNVLRERSANTVSAGVGEEAMPAKTRSEKHVHGRWEEKEEEEEPEEKEAEEVADWEVHHEETKGEEDEEEEWRGDGKRMEPGDDERSSLLEVIYVVREADAAEQEAVEKALAEDERLAQEEQRKEEEEHEAAKRAEDEDMHLAARLARELEDREVAECLQKEEDQENQRFELHRKCIAKTDAHLARKVADQESQERKALENENRRLAARSARAARQLEKAQVAEVKKEWKSLRNEWRKVRVSVAASPDQLRISVGHLKNVDSVSVTSADDSIHVHAKARRPMDSLKPIEFQATFKMVLEDHAQGDQAAEYSLDGVTHTYYPRSGTLCMVVPDPGLSQYFLSRRRGHILVSRPRQLLWW